MPLVVARHLEWMRQRGLAPSTIYKRSHVLSMLARFLDGRLCEATPDDLSRWRATLTVGDDATVSYVSHVRCFYAWAADAGIVDTDPARRLPAPRLGRRIPRPIGEQDLLHAITAAAWPVRQMLVLAGWCGLRAKEIALLRRVNVLETALPPVLLVEKDATKGRSERIVPLSAFVLSELVPILPVSGWVFRRVDGEPGPNQPWRVSQVCNQYLHACGITATLHQLRHRFGTGTYRVKRDLRVVQELLGHARITSTVGYAAFDNADAREAVENLPAPGHLHLAPSVSANT